MTTSSLLHKVFQFGSKPDASTFPELLTVVTSMRLLFGAMYGVSLAVRHETSGLVGLTMGLNLVAFAPMLWFNGYLHADVDSYKNLRFVGVFNGVAMMLLVWIMLFTYYHLEEEETLQKVLSDNAVLSEAANTEIPSDGITVRIDEF
jgi:hypothetical protein